MVLTEFLNFGSYDENKELDVTRVCFHEIEPGDLFIVRSVKDSWENGKRHKSELFMCVPGSKRRMYDCGFVKLERGDKDNQIWFSPCYEFTDLFYSIGVVDTLHHFYKLNTQYNTKVFTAINAVGKDDIPSKQKKESMRKKCAFKIGDIVKTTEASRNFYYNDSCDVFENENSNVPDNKKYTIDDIKVALSTATHDFDVFAHLSEMGDGRWVLVSTLVLSELDNLPTTKKNISIVEDIMKHGYSFDPCDDYAVYLPIGTPMYIRGEEKQYTFMKNLIVKRIKTKLIENRVALVVMYEGQEYYVYLDDMKDATQGKCDVNKSYWLNRKGSFREYKDDAHDHSFRHYADCNFWEQNQCSVLVEIMDFKFSFKSGWNGKTRDYEDSEASMLVKIRPKDKKYWGTGVGQMFYNGRAVWVDYTLLDERNGEFI